MNQPAKDMFDREIRVGDICAYPVRRGSEMNMNRLVVQKILYNIKGEPKLNGIKGNRYPVSITSLDRVVLVGRNNVIPFME